MTSRVHKKSPRQSPDISATAVDVGTIEVGNDGKPWVVTVTAGGVQRWTPYTSVRLNGLRVLTLDYLAKNVGKEITIYDRSAGGRWPSGIRERDMEKWTFIPDGNAEKQGRKTPWKDWLFTRKPSPPTRGYLMITGVRTSSGEDAMDRFWGPFVTGGEAATSNPRNTQSFVKA